MQSTHDTNFAAGAGNVTANPSPRRYVGRTGAHSSHAKGVYSPSMPHQLKREQGDASTPQRIRPAVVPWSFRLALMLSLVAVILILFRSFGLFTPPIDSPTGVEATYAASVNMLAGQVSGPLE